MSTGHSRKLQLEGTALDMSPLAWSGRSLRRLPSTVSIWERESNLRSVPVLGNRFQKDTAGASTWALKRSSWRAGPLSIFLHSLALLIKKKKKTGTYMSACLHVVQAPPMLDALKNQNRAMSPLKVGWSRVTHHHMGAGTELSHLQEQQHS